MPSEYADYLSREEVTGSHPLYPPPFGRVVGSWKTKPGVSLALVEIRGKGWMVAAHEDFTFQGGDVRFPIPEKPPQWRAAFNRGSPNDLWREQAMKHRRELAENYIEYWIFQRRIDEAPQHLALPLRGKTRYYVTT